MLFRTLVGTSHSSILFSANAHFSLGFFYIINFGLSQEDVDRQFSIGKEIFKLPIEEKLKFRAELEKGGYNGYKPMGLRVSEKLTSALRQETLSKTQSRKSDRECPTRPKSTTSPNSSQS